MILIYIHVCRSISTILDASHLKTKSEKYRRESKAYGNYTYHALIRSHPFKLPTGGWIWCNQGCE